MPGPLVGHPLLVVNSGRSSESSTSQNGDMVTQPLAVREGSPLWSRQEAGEAVDGKVGLGVFQVHGQHATGHGEHGEQLQVLDASMPEGAGEVGCFSGRLLV